jgi:hypothetical protein
MGASSAVVLAKATTSVILRSRALARRLEGSPLALVVHPSRLAAKGGEHLRMTAEYFFDVAKVRTTLVMFPLPRQRR